MVFNNIQELSIKNLYFILGGVWLVLSVGLTMFFYMNGWFKKESMVSM
jgi:hypothetical protein